VRPAWYSRRKSANTRSLYSGEVDRFDIHADHVGHAGRVDPVLTGGAVFAVVVIFPVLHEQADDFGPVPSAAMPRRESTRHTDHDFFLLMLFPKTFINSMLPSLPYFSYASGASAAACELCARCCSAVAAVGADRRPAWVQRFQRCGPPGIRPRAARWGCGDVRRRRPVRRASATWCADAIVQRAVMLLADTRRR
jgi:hypothetical protein